MRTSPPVPLYNDAANTNLGNGSIGPFDVRGFTRLRVHVVAEAANFMQVTPVWGDFDALAATAAGLSITGRVVTGKSLINQSATPLIVTYRNQGPWVRLDYSTLAASRWLAVWADNIATDHDGPVSPAVEGSTLYFGSDFFGGAGNAAHDLPPYAGRAIMVGSCNAGAPGQFIVRIKSGAAIIGGVTMPAAGPNPATGELWIPPVPCEVVNISGAGPQFVGGTVIAADV